MSKIHRSWLGWSGVAAMAAGMTVGLSFAHAPRASAQETTRAQAAAAVLNEPAPAPAGQFLSGPTMRETGRVGLVELSDTRANVKIDEAARGVSVMPKETSVQNAAEEVGGAVVVPPSGIIGGEALERETAMHFSSLAGCRLEIARRQQVTLGAVAAGRMTLRWTILPSGLTADTEVVAHEPADPQLVDCIKRRMSVWDFSRPAGGSVRVARPFAFR